MTLTRFGLQSREASAAAEAEARPGDASPRDAYLESMEALRREAAECVEAGLEQAFKEGMETRAPGAAAAAPLVGGSHDWGAAQLAATSRGPREGGDEAR
jgi:hypothetical protein